MSTAMPATTEQVDPPNDSWELVRLWKRAIKIAKWAFVVVLLLGFAVLADETIRLYGFFSNIHEFVGYAFLAAVAALLSLVAIPVWRYIQVPSIVTPPDVDLSDPELTQEQLQQRCRFLVRYTLVLRRNPEMRDHWREIEQIHHEVKTLYHELAQGGGSLADQVDRLKRCESDRIHPVLAELDRRIDSYIRKEAVAVGIGTAISMNGTLDAFIVLWRNANMVSRISRMYYGRPGLYGSLRILRDVAGAVVLGRAMDDISDMAGELIGKVVGRLGGLVAGPMVDGAVNALMTMKVGYLAKQRCRSFQAWNEKTARSVMTSVFRRVTSESAGVVTELATQVGGMGAVAAAVAKDAAVAGATAIASGARNAWTIVRDLFDDKAKVAANQTET